MQQIESLINIFDLNYFDMLYTAPALQRVRLRNSQVVLALACFFFMMNAFGMFRDLSMAVLGFAIPGYRTLQLYANEKALGAVLVARKWLSYWMVLAMLIWLEPQFLQIPFYYHLQVPPFHYSVRSDRDALPAQLHTSLLNRRSTDSVASPD